MPTWQRKWPSSFCLAWAGQNWIDEPNFHPEVYHLNEAHGFSAAFHSTVNMVRWKMSGSAPRFTTHTPEEAGNDPHDIFLCEKMGVFLWHFARGSREDHRYGRRPVQSFTGCIAYGQAFANGVSQLHGEVSGENVE